MTRQTIASATLAAKATRTLKIAMLSLATLGGAAALTGTVSTAEAKGGHGHGHHAHGHGHHHHHHFRHYGYRYGFATVAYAGGGCGWLKARAINTGAPYWWNRYHACVGY